MKLAASLFIAAAVLGCGAGHAAAGTLSTPATKHCVPKAVYGQQSLSGWVPVWYRDSNCRYTPARLVRVGPNRLRVQR
jgi:hypothetical protein